jgi:hypothetical protein
MINLHTSQSNIKTSPKTACKAQEGGFADKVTLTYTLAIEIKK